MNVIRPIVGEWYRGGTNELFEVVAIDDQDQTIEIQYFDGTVAEMDFDSWNEQLLDELIDAADAPEDWSGAVDVEAEDLDREFEDNARTAVVHSERSLAAPLTARVLEPPTRLERQRARFAASRAASSFSGLRKITSKISPGTAVRQVTTKKFAQPIAETRCPAIAPVTFRGKVARAESSAYCVALKFALHSDTKKATNAA